RHADFRPVTRRAQAVILGVCRPAPEPRMHRTWIACLTALLCLAAAPARAITIEQAMADPDWIGPPVEQPYWSLDGGSIYYRLKQKGTPVRDLHRIELANGQDRVVDPKAMAEADGAAP